MTAQDAKQLSQQKIEGKNSQDYKRVIARVKNEALLGKDFAWIYNEFPQSVREILIQDGYNLSEESNYRNEYLIKISW